ncbi:MAG TPA: hypothetical protein VHZ29_13070 [Rhizomicrobium sp.]|nr:hypothetical protein [Rhizomicrobium sp.]
MLTDLHDKLKGVGRLDVMTDVNKHALQYYDRQIGDLPPRSRAQRARVLQALGADDEERNDLGAASKKFEEAARTTSALLAEMPGDPDRIFDQAQSEYYFGAIDYDRGDFPAAKSAFEKYHALAKKMLLAAPSDPRPIGEIAYSEGNLCSVDLRLPKEHKTAINYCLAALGHMEQFVRRTGATAKDRIALVNRHSWLASAYFANDDDARATEQLMIEERILDVLMRADPLSKQLENFWVPLQRQIAWAELKSGKNQSARARLVRAIAVLDDMIKLDPSNDSWARLRAKTEQDLKQTPAAPGMEKPR